MTNVYIPTYHIYIQQIPPNIQNTPIYKINTYKYTKIPKYTISTKMPMIYIKLKIQKQQQYNIYIQKFKIQKTKFKILKMQIINTEI